MTKKNNTTNIFEKERYLKARFTLDYAVERSASWYWRKIQELKNISPTQLMKHRDQYRERPQRGEVYCFYYHAKHRDTLPYYDMFPLVLPLRTYKDGFLGMNFHYITPRHRILLVEEIKKHGSGPKGLTVSYDVVASFASSKYAEPTIKRYLYSQMGTPLRRIEAPDIPTALLVPCERFVKQKKESVWRDYKRK